MITIEDLWVCECGDVRKDHTVIAAGETVCVCGRCHEFRFVREPTEDELWAYERRTKASVRRPN